MSVRRALTAAEWDKSVTTSPAATAVTARPATSTTPFAKSARVRMGSAGCDGGGWWVEARCSGQQRDLTAVTLPPFFSNPQLDCFSNLV